MSEVSDMIFCQCSLNHVHVYIGIHFIDSVWSYWVEILCAGFLLYAYKCICIAIGDLIIKRGRGDSFNLFNPATFFCLSPAMTWISNNTSHGLSCVQWFQVRESCLLILEKLLKIIELSFHNFISILLFNVYLDHVYDVLYHL